MPYITLKDGCRIHVRDFGRGPNVLLYHGFGLDGRQWVPWARLWAHRFRFIIPDLRGHGRSQLGSYGDQHAIDRLVDDVGELREILQLDEETRLGAYSMGAMMTLGHLTRPHRPRVKQYLHIEMGPRFGNAEDWSYGFHKGITDDSRHLVEVWQEHGWNAESRWLYERLLQRLVWEAFPKGLMRSMAKHMPLAATHLSKASPDLAIHLFRHLIQDGFDFRPHVPHLQVPALLVTGSRSRYFNEGACLWLQKQWLGSEWIRFEKSGHGLMISEPQKFTRLFAQFLGEGQGLLAHQPELA